MSTAQTPGLEALQVNNSCTHKFRHTARAQSRGKETKRERERAQVKHTLLFSSVYCITHKQLMTGQKEMKESFCAHRLRTRQNNKSYWFSTTIRWCDSTDTSIEFSPNKRQDMSVKVCIWLALPVFDKAS